MYPPPYTLRFATSQPVALICADTTLWPILTTRFRCPGYVSGGRLPYLLEFRRGVVQPIFCQVSEFRGLNRSSNSPNVDGENSIPSWFSSIQLFACSGALWTVAGLESRAGARTSANGWVWPLFFLLLSVDEAVSFHELLSDVLEETFDVSGFFYFAWVVPGTLFVVVTAGLYLYFVWNLPAWTRYLMLAAGGIFLYGTLGVEHVTYANHETRLC